MREVAFIPARAVAAAATVLSIAVAGCDLGGLTGPDGLFDVSVSGEAPEPGQDVVFEGPVVSVDVEGASFRLGDGTDVRITDATALSDEFEVGSLDALVDVLEGERDAIAWGRGRVATVEPLVIDGAELTLKAAERIEFEGRVAAVDAAAGMLTLEDGTVVQATRATEFGDDFDVPSLEAAVEALEGGKELVAWGNGWERRAEPRALLASAVTFKITYPPTVEFEGRVASVKPDSGIVHLENGTVVRVTEETRIENDDGIRSLDAARQRLEAGDSLAAWGHGGLEGEEPRTIAAYALVFNVPGYEPAEFEGHVAAVYPDLGKFELTGGTVVIVDAETSFNAEYEIPSLEAAKQALDAGKIVSAWGHGRLESEEPRTVIASEVTFKEVQ